VALACPAGACNYKKIGKLYICEKTLLCHTPYLFMVRRQKKGISSDKFSLLFPFKRAKISRISLVVCPQSSGLHGMYPGATKN